MAYSRAKKLTDTTYSPTNAASEPAIRAQVDGAIQEVYDMLASIINGSSGADYIGIGNDTGLIGATVKEQLKNVKDGMNGLVLGQIPDNTISKAKLNPSLQGEINSALVSTKASYIAFCSNVNTNSLDAAFGKNNEDRMTAIGLQLAMYAWFKGDSKATYPFASLCQLNSLDEIALSDGAIDEILANSNLYTLVTSNDYAKGKLFIAMVNRKLGFNIASYPTISSFVSSSTAMNALAQNNTVLAFALNNSPSFDAALLMSNTALQALYDYHTVANETTMQASTLFVSACANCPRAQSANTTNYSSYVQITSAHSLIVKSDTQRWTQSYKVGTASRQTSGNNFIGFVMPTAHKALDSLNSATTYYITW